MRRWAAMTLLGAGMGLLALPACGGKTDEKARAAGITPTDALAFFSVNLAPSIEQKRNLQGILGKFPGVADEVRGDFEDALDGLLDDVTEEAGLDYETDVKPWLGNEVALVVLPLAEGETFFEGGEPPVVVMFETDDAAKATQAIEKSADEGHFDGQFRVVEDFLVVASSDDEDIETDGLDQIEAAAKAKGGGLAAAGKFTSVVDELAGDRLLLAWADGAALQDAIGADERGFPSVIPFSSLGSAGPAAADLHAEKSALVVRGVAVADGEEGGGGEPALTAGLPADLLGALTLFNVGDPIRQGLEAVVGFGGGDIKDFASEVGVDIEEDLLSWMEGELVIVAGPVPDGQDFPDFAVVVEPTDRDKAEAGLEKVADALADQGFELERRDVADASAYVVPEEFLDGLQPAMALFDDRFVLANNVDFLEALAADASPSLGESDAYQSVIGKGSRSGTGFQLLVRIDPIREAIEAALSRSELSDYEDEARANIEPLNTFGMFSRRDGDRYRFEMRLTLD